MSDNIFINIRANAQNLKQTLSGVTSSLNALGKTAQKNSGNFGAWYNSTRKLNQAFVNINKDANRTANGIKSVSSSLMGLRQIMGVGMTFAVGNSLADMINSTMAMTETINLFNVALGDTAVKTNEVVKHMSELYGLDPTNLQNSVGTFAMLSRSMGMTTEQSSTLSTNVSQLATDLSSLTNVPIQQVMSDLKSGLVGQSETVYKYGIDVTEAGIKAEAMRQGISKSVRNMSQGEKMALRYSAMIRQSGLAQGDFGRTIETPANQMRVLAERFVTLGRAIGSIFMPLLGAVLPYLNAFVQLLTRVANAIARFFGFKPPEIMNTTGSAIGGIGDEADDTTDAVDGTSKALKKLKQATMGFDEINLLPQEQNASGSGGTGVGGDSILPDMKLPTYDDFFNGTKAKSDAICQSMVQVCGQIGKLVDKVVMFGKAVGDKLQAPLKHAVDMVAPQLNAFVDYIESAFSDLASLENPLSKLFWDDMIPLLQDSITYIGEILAVLLETVTMVLSGLWNTVIFPNMILMTTTVLPMVTNVASSILQTVTILVTELSVIFGKLWTEGVMPIVTNIMKIWSDCWLLVKDFWDKYGSPIFDAINLAIEKTSSEYIRVWNALMKPLIDEICQAVDWIWSGHLKKLVENVLGLVGTLAQLVFEIYNKFLSPLVDLFLKYFAPVLKDCFSGMVQSNKILFGLLIDIINGVVTALRVVITVISGAITGDWRKAWQGLSDIFKPIVEGLSGILRDAMNSVIGVLNGSLYGIENFLNGIISGVNKAIKGFNELKSAMGMDGDTSTVPTVSLPRIPRLARGGMLTDGSLFQAGENGKAEMIGSYNNNTTVMPLENTSFVGAMYDAVFNAVSSALGSGGDSGDIVLQVGSTEFGRIAIDSINKITKQDGNLSLKV